MSKPADRRGLGDVERLALRYALDHVEQDDVAEFLQTDQMRERAADLPAPIRAIRARAMLENPWERGEARPGGRRAG